MQASLKQILPIEAAIICPQKFEHATIKCIPVQVTGNYSQWILKNLKDYMSASHSLVQQWDSCVLDPNFWTDRFLEYDYIGAPWPSGPHRVGNGGFSLRSAKFLEESAKIADLLPIGNPIYDNEDYYACVTCAGYLRMKGIKFAPLELARQFSVERPIPESPHTYDDLSTYKSFGFHGEFCTSGMRRIEE